MFPVGQGEKKAFFAMLLLEKDRIVYMYVKKIERDFF